MERSPGRSWDVSSMASSSGAVEDEEGHKLYVAVPEEFKHGKNVLMWALQNLVTEGSKILIVHVHCPLQYFSFMGAKVHFSRLKEEEVNYQRKIARQKVDGKLDEYVRSCLKLRVSCEILVVEMDDVAKGLEELIHLHGITKLVMGAAADKHFSKKMRTPKSKTALKLLECAPLSCKIYFVCHGTLICTREANTVTPAIPPSPSVGSHSFSAPPSPRTNIPDDYRMSNDSVELNVAPRLDIATSRGKQQSHDHAEATSLALGGPVGDGGGGGRILYPSLNELNEELHIPCPIYEPVEAGSGISESYAEKLRESLDEAENLKKEAYEESSKRIKAERELLAAIQRIQELEGFCSQAAKEKDAVKNTLTRERQEAELLRKQRDEMFEELIKVKERKEDLEKGMSDLGRDKKFLEEKAEESKVLIKALQSGHAQLQNERDAAMQKTEELQNKLLQASRVSSEILITEFTYGEVMEATEEFNPSFKIGEGSGGSVYRGILRNTVVALKMLNKQDITEFNNEAAFRSRMKHPKLVSLIGVCTEAFCLVYEYLPNGSLEDRLACKNNSAPLKWQARVQIIGDVCLALMFLHSNKPQPLVHGNLKPSNILLDANFSAKLADFASSSTSYPTIPPDRVSHYTDPEYTGQNSLVTQSDVYSLGIIILRVLTGKEAAGITRIVEAAWNNKTLDKLIDPAAGEWPFVQAQQLAYIGKQCADQKRRKRPDLVKDVWRVVEPMLKSATTQFARSPSLALASDDNAPSYFLCPIFQEVMNDPQMALDGFTYEAEAIKGWLGDHNTSPMTNLELPTKTLIPNRALRSTIQEWLQQRRL